MHVCMHVCIYVYKNTRKRNFYFCCLQGFVSSGFADGQRPRQHRPTSRALLSPSDRCIHTLSKLGRYDQVPEPPITRRISVYCYSALNDDSGETWIT